MCRRLGIFLLVLSVASFSLWAFPGRVTGSQEKAPSDTSVQEVREEGLKTDSGWMSESASTESSGDSMISELKDDLILIKEDLASLELVSKEKDAVIDCLSDEMTRLKDESGTKFYLMVDAIMGFDEKMPDYGVGLTLGTRVGNSIMLEAGADYMLGSSKADLLDFSMEDLTFRAGLGWMF